MYQIDYKTFTKLVNHNTKILKKAIKNKVPLTDILSQLKTSASLNSNEVLHSSIIMRKSFDILPAAYLGLLPLTTPNGADALKVLPNGKVIEYEIKTTEVNSKNQLWTDFASGKLYRGRVNTAKKGELGSRKTVLGSVLRATYHIHSAELIETKNRQTILLCADVGSEDGYFDAWELPGKYITEFLGARIDGEERRSIKREISMLAFMQNGTRAQTVVPLKGYEAWEEEVSQVVPQLETGEEMPGYMED